MVDTPDVLKRIVTKKWEEIERKKSLTSFSEMERIFEETSYDRRGFVDAIRRCIQEGRVGVIAEIKKASLLSPRSSRFAPRLVCRCR